MTSRLPLKIKMSFAYPIDSVISPSSPSSPSPFIHVPDVEIRNLTHLTPGPVDKVYCLFFAAKNDDGTWNENTASFGELSYSIYSRMFYTHPMFFKRHIPRECLDMSPVEFYAHVLARRELVVKYLNSIGVSGTKSKGCFAVNYVDSSCEENETVIGTNSLSYYCLSASNLRHLDEDPDNPEFNEKLHAIHKMYKMTKHTFGPFHEWTNRDNYWYGGNCGIASHYFTDEKDFLICDHYILSKLLDKTVCAIFSEFPGRKLKIGITETNVEIEDRSDFDHHYKKEESWDDYSSCFMNLYTPAVEFMEHDMFSPELTVSLRDDIIEYIRNSPNYDSENSILKEFPKPYLDIAITNFFRSFEDVNYFLTCVPDECVHLFGCASKNELKSFLENIDTESSKKYYCSSTENPIFENMTSREYKKKESC